MRSIFPTLVWLFPLLLVLMLIFPARPTPADSPLANTLPVLGQHAVQDALRSLTAPPVLPPRSSALAYWDVCVNLSLTAVTPDTHISMLLPLSDGRQSIVSRRTHTPGVRYWEETDEVNLWGHWQVTDTMPQQIRYAYTVQISEIRTVLPQHPFPFQTAATEALPYLAASEMIQSDMPQIQQRAWRVVQHARRLDHALEALYDYIAGFGASHTTETSNDALAVLSAERGGRAGKARALVAVLRAVGIPARVVGGIRLGDVKQARTTMYWAEAFVGRTWVPMDPAGGYFGRLPNTYLALYRNDLPLLAHTRHVSVDYSFVIEHLTRRAALATEADPRPEGLQDHQQFWTATAYVDRPRASVVLIHESPLSEHLLQSLLTRARAAGVNASIFSTPDGSRAFRQACLRTVLDVNSALLRDANLVVLNTYDAAGLYALLDQDGLEDRLHDTRLVIASGVVQPVGRIFAALIDRVLEPASVVLLPYQPNPSQIWETSLVGLTLSLPPSQGGVELSGWRAGVVSMWQHAIRAKASLLALNAILVLPVIAFFLVILRNLIGLETFGFFAPMLLALAFLTTGLGWGLLIFGAIIGVGGGLRLVLQRLRLHLVARVAILIAVVAVSMTGLTLVGAQLGIGELLHVGIFPMVIIANMIENFSNTQLERGTREALRLTVNTLLVALLSYGCIENTDLRPLLLAFPELLVAIVGLEVLIGCWRGMRLVEYLRFVRVLRQAAAPDRI